MMPLLEDSHCSQAAMDLLEHRWQTQGPPPCFICPALCFYLVAVPSSRLGESYIKGVVTLIQSSNDIQPFEGNCEADVAPSENEFDTPV